MQDDWRVSRKLTLNLGLRWEYESPVTERYNRTTLDFDSRTANPIQSQAQAQYAKAPLPELPAANFRTIGGVTFAGVNGNPRGIRNAFWPAFMPRLGLAYQVDRRLVISIPNRKLAVVEDGRVTRIYDVAVGKDSTPSPDGTFRVANRMQDPTWYGPKQTVPPGKDNPLGNRWMGLGYRGYGIHGTNHQQSVVKAASHGCFRMRKADIEELFELVRVGDTVEIVRELNPTTAALFNPAPVAIENAVAAGGGE